MTDKLQQVREVMDDTGLSDREMFVHIRCILSTPQEKPMPDEMSDGERWELIRMQTRILPQNGFEAMTSLAAIRKIVPSASFDPEERARGYLDMANINGAQRQLLCQALCTDCADGDVPRKESAYIFMHGPKCWNRKCEASGLRRLLP